MELLSGVLATVPIWLLWPIVVGIAVYWYLAKHNDHWKSIGIPYVPSLPILGSMLDLFRYPMHDVEVQRYKKNGRIYGAYEGSTAVLNVAEPDILRDIFVKDFQVFTSRRNFSTGNMLMDNMVSNLQGEDWKRVRAVMTPAFSTGKIKRMISIFTDSAKVATSNFKAAAKEGKEVDMKRMFGAFTMDVIASSAFATKIDSHNDPENLFVRSARNTFTNPFPWRFVLFFMFPGLMRFFRISVFNPHSMKFFEKVTLGIVEERKRSKQKRNDFLQLMIDAVEREGEKEETEDVNENEETKEMGHEEGNEQIFKSYQSSKALSNTEMVANSVIFFLAGYDTTATTLSFASYELALNPDVQERVIAEVDQALKKQGELNYEALNEMKYLDNVISETLRKYPPAVRSDRKAEEDYVVKGHDMEVNVPKGMLVGIPIYAIHHDPEYYPDPEKFDPDRFNQEEKSSRHPYTYLPFGAGPRNCVGMRFALMEIKVCLAQVLSQCRFVRCSNTDVPLQFLSFQGLMQPKKVALKLELRNDARKS